MRFVANDTIVETEAWALSPALDFIRRDLGLVGTKEGCREGDCGSCAVLVGRRLEGGAASYRAMPSCLLALGDLEAAHLVTIEGLSMGGAMAGAGAAIKAEEAGSPRGTGLTPVMAAIVEENGSQCGFCTPGFVISLTAFLLEGPPISYEKALMAMEGNLCRCTGYGALRRAAARIAREFATLPQDCMTRLETLVEARVVPPSLLAFARGELLPPPSCGTAQGEHGAMPESMADALVIGGGTDFFVRNPDPGALVGDGGYPPHYLVGGDPELCRIEEEADGGLVVGAAVTIRDFFASAAVRAAVPGIEAFESEFASVLVRNRATLGGNVSNASPVGDMTAMLIALGAIVRVGPVGARGGTAGVGSRSPSIGREMALERLFLGYKKLDLGPGEILRSFVLKPRPRARFNFEKVAKRRSLDIAAVNTGILLELEGQPGTGDLPLAAPVGRGARIARGRISAGGVAPVPLLLGRSSALLAGREIDADTARAVAAAAAAEVEPISDVRGSAGYRRRLLERLVLAHFARLFPGSGIAEEALR